MIKIKYNKIEEHTEELTLEEAKALRAQLDRKIKEDGGKFYAP